MKVTPKQTKKIPFIIGVFFVVAYATLLFLNPRPMRGWIDFLQNRAYDLQLRQSYQPLLKSGKQIAIVDIDDASLQVEGHWPWPRKKVGVLVQKLYQMGAKVIAFDITFPEAEENIDQTLIDALKAKEPANPAIGTLEAMKEEFNGDAFLGKSLAGGTSVLGVIFLPEGKSEGVLPLSNLKLSPLVSGQLAIPDMPSYLGNLPVLQKSAASAGFINSLPDRDGILRFSPLLMHYGDTIYPALGLEAARWYLSTPPESLIIEHYGDESVLEAIQLGSQAIPVDPSGQLLVPFRGRAFTFSYLSAVDVLSDKVSKEDVAGKLIFVGSTAAALGDFHATAIAPVFPGVEIHATIAAGIIDGYLPYKPAWSKGVEVVMVLFFGLLCAIVFPFLTPLLMVVCSAGVMALLFGINHWVWSHLGIVLPVFLPMFAILILFIIDLVGGYIFQTRSYQVVRGLFEQYVSPLYIDKMFKEGATFSLTGEHKELTVLFSDIRGFTPISEELSATEVKSFLDSYFTRMTQVIFNTQGTIDKYVGDEIMAFWGAPLENHKHAFYAVTAAFEMHAELIRFNEAIRKQKLPEIQIGVGINTGNVIVGDMGSSFRRNYTVIGDPVNLSSRLEGLTKLYHVSTIVGERTYHETKHDFIYRKIDKVKVKGKKMAVEIYQPLCLANELTETLRVELEKHDQALECYFQQKWDESKAIFEQLATAYPKNQPLYEVYLQRMRDSTPPGLGWDGSYVLTRK